MRLFWSDKEEEILKKMVDACKTPKDVSEVLLNRSEDSVRCKAGSMGLVWKSKPEIDMDAYARMMKGETKCL